jgi:hypothetical protein
VNDWRTSSFSYGGGACVEAATAWRTSSFSETGNCVEAATAWRTASASMNNGACVEAASGSGILVRDTKDRGGTLLAFPVQAWRAFTAGLQEAGAP